MLSRRDCEAVGVCREEYTRYKIDDDIYATYHILAQLGHQRIVYLPDVVFEHRNFENLHRAHLKTDAARYITDDRRVYEPKPELYECDLRVFEEMLEQRKQDALKLATIIDRDRDDQTRREYAWHLLRVRDPYDYRRERSVTAISSDQKSHSTTQIAVSVITPDKHRRQAKRCIAAIKKHTRGVVLQISESRSRGFSEATAPNSLLTSAATRFLAIVDDNILVTPGWLDGLLKVIDDQTALVAPIIQNQRGATVSSGVYFVGDDWGSYSELATLPVETIERQALRRGLLLVDVQKCRGNRFDEHYRESLQVAFCLKVWETGYKVKCTPSVKVTRLKDSNHQLPEVLNDDLIVFSEEWIRTGRLNRLTERIWSKQPSLREVVDLAAWIERLFARKRSGEPEAFQDELFDLIGKSKPYSMFQALITRHLREFAESPTTTVQERSMCEAAQQQLNTYAFIFGPQPISEEFYKGYNLVAYLDREYAVPVTINYRGIVYSNERSRPEILTAKTNLVLKDRVDEAVNASGLPGGSFTRLRWELIRVDSWLRRDRRTRWLEFLTRAYVQIPGRVFVALSIRLNRYAMR